MTKHSQLVFIDTNVWFSAFYGSANAGKILKAHVGGELKAVISQDVLAELARNIKKKYPKALGVLRDFLEASPPVILSRPKTTSLLIQKLVEKKDRVIFQSVVNAKIKYFITGNLKDFNVSKIEKELGIYIVSPREAIEKLLEN